MTEKKETGRNSTRWYRRRRATQDRCTRPLVAAPNGVGSNRHLCRLNPQEHLGPKEKGMFVTDQ